ncbi:hypothetical protein [Nonomuraea dietziae]|uniref:hypothetical protein n=1 Tax=Nonomuraea dietziae TaxID=65515 RepID=UPI0031E3D9ED
MAGPDGGWPGLNGDENTVEFSVERMRAIDQGNARRPFSVMNGRGHGRPGDPG